MPAVTLFPSNLCQSWHGDQRSIGPIFRKESSRSGEAEPVTTCKVLLDKCFVRVIVRGMVVAVVGAAQEDAVEVRRRSLMRESDELLDEVETLRTQERREVPPELREAIRTLHLRLGRPDPPVAPSTLRAAHDLVFAVQQRLMAANPSNPRPHRHVGRPSGQPIVTVVRGHKLWKLLTLPAQPPGGDRDVWLELVQDTVERAWDRWCYAQHQAVSAARERRRPEVALAVARTAWTNYWELHEEAGRFKARIGADAERSTQPVGSAAALVR